MTTIYFFLLFWSENRYCFASRFPHDANLTLTPGNIGTVEIWVRARSTWPYFLFLRPIFAEGAFIIRITGSCFLLFFNRLSESRIWQIGSLTLIKDHCPMSTGEGGCCLIEFTEMKASYRERETVSREKPGRADLGSDPVFFLSPIFFIFHLFSAMNLAD